MEQYKALIQAMKILDSKWSEVYQEYNMGTPASAMLLHASEYLKQQAKQVLRGE
jgi:hypothetical protein